MPIGVHTAAQKAKMINGNDGRKYGLYGKDYLRIGTPGQESSPTGIYYDTLQFITDTVFSSITDEDLPTDEQTTAFLAAGTTFPAGMVIQGRFTGLTILAESTGKVIAYRGREE